MANYIMHPVSISYSSLSYVGTSSITAVNKGPTTFDDSTYLYTQGFNYDLSVSYYFDAPTMTGTINRVSVYYRTSDVSYGLCNIAVGFNGPNYSGTAHSMSASFTNYSQYFDLNPNTGNSWAWEELGLPHLTTFQIHLIAYSPSYAYCSAFWLDVDYTPTAGSSYFLRNIMKTKRIP